MTKEQYEKWSKLFVEHPQMTKGLLLANKLMTYACYILYPLLLVIEKVTGNNYFWRTLFTAGISFLLLSLFRRIYNKPRPYEELDICQIIPKDTKGKSFPSRHVFSVFVIAMCWLFYMPVVGIILFVLGIFMGVLRVCGGVHYPIDVIVGAVIGILSGVVGFVVL